ncbi:NAD(P)-dependent oxidoreductase [Spirillospora sp. CA-128828]|uniref:NAD(P)-dependent oxidoreductase n=1 Tax=Spirillospora sp. CA-128828 TaxID=3240033 RepID=UPI003D8DAA2B
MTQFDPEALGQTGVEITGHPTIGLVGLGHMGGAMAERLLAAGYPVHGTSRTPQRAQSLLSQGLRWQESPRAVAEASDVILSSIPDDEALEAIASGPDGILAGLTPGTVWADMSTVSPHTSRRIAAEAEARGATMLDAPVSGSAPQADTGSLTIMVGGSHAGYALVEPILRDLGTPAHVGSNGQGLAMKLAISISLAAQMVALAEGLVLAERSGVDRKLAARLMADSVIGSPLLKARARLVPDVPGESSFELRLLRRDLELALDVARRLQIPHPTADRTDEVLGIAAALGYERRDIAALIEVLEQMTEDPA